MDSSLKNAAMAVIAPKVVKSFRWQWLLYGAAAYYVLKYLAGRGFFGKMPPLKQFIDVEATSVQEKIDLSDYRPSDVAQASTLH
ncbi:hypothetical protein [Pseudobdellovibrio exovorus]|uniref:Uncharacterized protein n=1 Tax=Pseudobdellovibrio exovorus JSS TaxID=1184267 RepID=M4V9R5_9BACT|nr:hypothetical protein [Pseudobdellovibrio exovorus]AGH95953.1 hypothetical protein A11Q_1737 [Pseudobdellovibrio exovorus JSS]